MSVLASLIGEVLDGKYLIEKELGQGGMGAVYLARHLGTERPVALKVIVPEHMTDDHFVDRFKLEAVAAGRLRHPNVVNVTDFGFASFGGKQVAYLVMEYLDGSTLADMLEKYKQLPLDQVLDIVEQVCLAIDEAHKQSIIHRDLKPENIWLQPDGRGGYNVKVLDFGLAKLRTPVLTASSLSTNDGYRISTTTGEKKSSSIVSISNEIENIADFDENATVVTSPLDGATLIKTESQSVDPNRTVVSENTAIAADNKYLLQQARSIEKSNQNITRAGTILGTPVYMSPEQCAGKTLDESSDIYSLAVVVYEMLAGAPPFEGSIRELIKQHIEVEPKSIREKRKDLPQCIESLLAQALSKRPEDRPPSAAAFAAAMRINTEGETPILRESLKIYSKHFTSFLLLSTLLLLPYMAINFCFIMLTLSDIVVLPTSISVVIKKGYFLVSFLIAMLASSVNTGVFAPVVELIYNSSNRRVDITKTLKDFYKRFPAITTTVGASYLQIFLGLVKLLLPGVRSYILSSLSSLIVVTEGKKGREAIDRSQELVKRLFQPMLSIQVRNIFLCGAVVVTAPMCFVLLSLVGSLVGEQQVEILISQNSSLPSFIFIPLSFTVPWIFLVLFQPIIAIASSLLYIKSRQIRGEYVQNSWQEQDFLIKKSLNWVRIARTKNPIFLTVLLVVLFGGFAIRNLALTYASSSGLIGMVEALLLVGADANAKVRPELTEDFKTTPLLRLIESGVDQEVKKKIAKLLLDYGANPSEDNEYGWTPLLEAVKQEDMELVDLLIAKGAAINSRANNGYTPLIMAASKGNKKIVERLLSEGADVASKDYFGYTALNTAILDGHAYVVKPLLDKGCNPNTPNRHGVTPLMIAAYGGDGYIVKLLLEKGAEVNASDKDGETALIFAVKAANREVVEQLVEKGADIDLRRKDGLKAIDIATSSNQKEILEILKSAKLSK
ncbi:MAG: ankyrin repeat domain-containing protein [Blastocatellia bacterium]|nr:ankyrin repeat domain-containing protein [Blastocatellia bacterium]